MTKIFTVAEFIKQPAFKDAVNYLGIRLSTIEKSSSVVIKLRKAEEKVITIIDGKVKLTNVEAGGFCNSKEGLNLLALIKVDATITESLTINIDAGNFLKISLERCVEDNSKG